MDKDIDIYEDLPSFNTNDPATHSTSADEFAKNCSELTKQVNVLTEKVKKLEKENGVLEVNLFSLLKTAKGEIARKDRMIADLRKELDDALFRRSRNPGRTKPPIRPKIEPIQRPPPITPNPILPIKQESDVSNTYTMEGEVTSTDTDNPMYVEEEYDEHKAVESQRKAQETVFGKRLRERILNEQKAAAIEKDNELKKSVESSVPESNKNNGLKHYVDSGINNLCSTQKNSSTNDTPTVDKVSNTCPSDKHPSSEIFRKRTNEDVFNLPPSKRIKSNDTCLENEVEPDSQYNSNLIDSKTSNPTNGRHTPTFEDKKYERNNYARYDRKKGGKNCFDAENNRDSQSRYMSEGYATNVEPQCNDFERRQYYKQDFDEKRDNHWYKNTNRKLQSNSRERSREKTVYHEKNREFNHYEKEKNYQQYNKLSDRRYGNKNYDRYYSDDHRNHRSNSRNRDNFKERDSNSSTSFRREVYDLRAKVDNTYEKKSDFIYYESNKYKKEKHTVEAAKRSRRSPSVGDKNKNAETSTRLCKQSLESTKTKSEETKALENENVQNDGRKFTTDEAQSTATLEDGELMDTPNSSPVKESTSKLTNVCEILDTGKPKMENENTLRLPLNTDETANEMQTKKGKEQNVYEHVIKLSTDVIASPREEAIENIQKFIQNYDEQENTNRDHINSKDSNKEASTRVYPSVESVVDALSKIENVVEKVDEKKGDKTGKEQITVKSNDSQNQYPCTNASDGSNIEKPRLKFRIPKLKPKELAAPPCAPVPENISEKSSDQTHNTVVKLSAKLDGIIKVDGTLKSSPTTVRDSKPKDILDTNLVTDSENQTTNHSGVVSVNNHVHSNVEKTSTGALETDKKNLNEKKDFNNILLRENSSNPAEDRPSEEKSLTEQKKDSDSSDRGDDSDPIKCTLQSVETSAKVETHGHDNDEERNSSKRSKPEGSTTDETKIDSCVKDNKQTLESQNSTTKTIESKNNVQNNDRCKVLVARRRKPVQLGDMNASMTIVMNPSNVKCNNNVNSASESSNTLKPRACKVSRSYKKVN